MSYTEITVTKTVKLPPPFRAVLTPGPHLFPGDWRGYFRNTSERRLITAGILKVEYFSGDLPSEEPQSEPSDPQPASTKRRGRPKKSETVVAPTLSEAASPSEEPEPMTESAPERAVEEVPTEEVADDSFPRIRVRSRSETPTSLETVE